MSRIAISASATGTGTVTLAAPVTNTDRTIVLPDSAGTILTTATPGVPIGGPAFSAFRSGVQAVPSLIWTKVLYQVEEFDTNLNYDTTLARFTPTVPGYYQFSAALEPTTAQSYLYLAFYKNNSPFKRSATESSFGTPVNGSVLIYMNGSTDYVELYTLFATSNTMNGSFDVTFFQGALVRSAT